MFNLLFLLDPKNLFSDLKSGPCYIVFTFHKPFFRTAAILPALACSSCFLLRHLLVLFPVNYFKTPFGAPKWFFLLSPRVSHYQTIGKTSYLGRVCPQTLSPPLISLHCRRCLVSRHLHPSLWRSPWQLLPCSWDTFQSLQWLQTHTGITPKRTHPCTPHLLSVPYTHGLYLKSFPAETVTLCSVVVLRSRLLPFSASSGIMKDFPDSI